MNMVKEYNEYGEVIGEEIENDILDVKEIKELELGHEIHSLLKKEHGIKIDNYNIIISVIRHELIKRLKELDYNNIKTSIIEELKNEIERKEREERKKIIKSACIYKYEYDINYELEMQGLINKHYTENKLFVVDNETVDESLQDLKADIILRLTEANRQIVKSIVERFKSRQKL